MVMVMFKLIRGFKTWYSYSHPKPTWLRTEYPSTWQLHPLL